MQQDKTKVGHKDVIIPDNSKDNQDDARLNEDFEKFKEDEMKRKDKIEKLDEEKLKEKNSEED